MRLARCVQASGHTPKAASCKLAFKGACAQAHACQQRVYHSDLLLKSTSVLLDHDCRTVLPALACPQLLHKHQVRHICTPRPDLESAMTLLSLLSGV